MKHFLYIALIALIASTFPANVDAEENNPFDGMFQDAIEKTNKRTAKIFGAKIGSVDGYGTGLIVSDNGKIITSDGVYLSGSTIRVTLHDGTTYLAEIVRKDPNLKLALLDISAKTPHYFSLTDKPVGEKGDWILAISNAFKVAERTEKLSVNLGVISLRTAITSRQGRREIVYDGPLILIDAITSNPGAGGGAAITATGELVGMIGKIIQSNETNTRLNYVVPQENLYNFLLNRSTTVADVNESTEKAELGIRLFRLGGTKGPAYVDRVIRGGPAQKAGIRPDDLLISIDGDRVANIADYHELVDALIPKEEILIVVKRRQELLRIKLTPDVRE